MHRNAKMKTRNILIILALFLATAAAIKLSIATVGCCTNPNSPSVCYENENLECCPDQSAFPSYYLRNVTDQATCNENFFVPDTNCGNVNLCNLGCCCYSESAASTYGAFCNETFLPLEEGRSCEDTCGIPIPDTNSTCSPTLNLASINMKGEKQIQLFWQSPCDANSYNISKCKGRDCKDFRYLSITHDLNFTDSNETMLWNQYYTYNVTAKINSTYYSETKSIYIGDLECWKKYTNRKFCVHEYVYNEEPIKTYLISKLNYSAIPDQFLKQVIGNYSGNFNSAMYCDDSNRLKSSTIRCSGNQVCTVSANDEARCVDRSECGEIGKPFGMFSSRQTCENTYCFYGKSQGNVDSCYDCSIKMSCYDYKSRDSCQSNNCGLGNCEWRATNDEFGLGVCIDLQKNNCKWCYNNPKGTDGIGSNKAYNDVFDACNQKRAEALSTQTFNCTSIAISCNSTCSQFDREECDQHSPIEMESNNFVVPKEIDECGLNVCKWFGGVEYGAGICKKNADRDPNEDCQNQQCEKDYFPPETSMRQERQNLIINVIDKKTSTGYPTRMDNALTIICFQTENEYPSRCANAAEFDFNTTQSLLSIQELVNIGLIRNGNNIASFYSIDENKNLEVVKTMTIDASAIAPEGMLSITTKDGQTGRPIVANLYVDNRSNFKGISPLSANIRTGNHSFIAVKLGYRDQTGNFEIFSGQITTIETTMTPKPGPVNSGNLSVDAFDSIINTRIMADAYADEAIAGTTPITIALAPGRHNVRIEKQGYRAYSEAFDISSSQNKQIIANLVPLQGPTGTGNLSIITTDAISGSIIGAELKIDDSGPIHITPVTVTGLTPGIHRYNISKQGYYDVNGTAIINPSEKQIIRAIMVPISSPTVLQINLVNPKLMATELPTYDFIISTNKPATCKEDISNKAYESMQTLFYTEGNIVHMISRFPIVNMPVYVKCKDFEGNVKGQAYTIQLIQGQPSLSIYANPSTIMEMPILSNLSAESDQEVVCRRASSQTVYEQMTEFEGNDENSISSYKRLQVQLLSQELSDETTNTIFVQCKNKAGKLSEQRSTTIRVDTSSEPGVELEYLRYSSKKNIQIKATTNRDANCIYANNSEYSQNSSFGPKGTLHLKGIPLASAGRYKYYVKCKFNNNAEKEATAEFIIDDTPPSKPFVDGEATASLSTIMGYWNSTDNESGIKIYQYAVFEKSTNRQILSWINTTDEQETIRNLNLTKGSSYYIKAMALNRADLWSLNGISSEITFQQGGSDHCRNKAKDAGETGIDCGGKECNKCKGGEGCGTGSDCESGLCINKTCTFPSCKDGTKNQNETDADCGGQNCKKCENSLSCIINSDCISSSCVNLKCSASWDSCSNGKLDQQTESDIDCGKACTNKGKKCDTGKFCELDGDCKSSKCISSKCAAENDVDGDGILDGIDNCPNTFNPDQSDADDDGTGDACEESKPPAPKTENQLLKLLIWLFGIVFFIGILVLVYIILQKKKTQKQFKKDEKEQDRPKFQPQQIRIKPEVEQAIMRKREKELANKRKEALKSFEQGNDEMPPEIGKKQEETDVFSKLKKKTGELKSKK